MRRILFVSIILVLVAATAHADGVKIPPVGVKALPQVPHQTALIRYKDGVETLMVQSSFQGEGEEFMWILPVPDAPTSFEVASPGLFTTLNHAFQPEITIEVSRWWMWVTAFILVWTGIAFSLKLSMRRALATGGMLILSLVPILFFLPRLGHYRSAGSDPTGMRGVTLESEVEVGPYTVSVLEAESFAGLNAWLADGGFREIPADGERDVAQYLADGWRFVVARLTRDGDGFSRPDPLAVTFATGTPVYPMKLTRLADSDLYLDLFVIAEGEAVVDYATLRREFVGIFEAQDFEYDAGKQPVLVDAESGTSIGHPGLMALMWPSCVATKLHGTVAPSEMTRDIAIDVQAPKSFRAHFYSQAAAIESAIRAGALLWCVLTIVAVLAASRLYREGPAPEGRLIAKARESIAVPLLSVVFLPIAHLVAFHVLRVMDGGMFLFCSLLIAAVVGAVLLAGITFRRYGSPNTTRVLQKKGWLGLLASVAVASLFGVAYYQHLETIETTAQNLPSRGSVKYMGSSVLGLRPELAKAPFDDIAAAVLDDANAWRAEREEPAVEIEDSPGNFILLRDERGLVVRSFAYDPVGLPMENVLREP